MGSKKRKDLSDTERLRARALKSLQRLRRVQEMDEEGYVICISCGKRLKWSEAQGGHFIPRGDRATSLEYDNVWPQCPECNATEDGNHAAYRKNLIDKIGLERVERLENMSFARQGGVLALKKLSAEDQRQAVARRTMEYYLAKAQEFDAQCIILEGKN